MKLWPHSSDRDESENTLRLEFVGLALLIVLAALAALAFFASRAGADLSLASPSEAFTCTPVAVYDGDGPIWCGEGPRVRLEAIAAREMDGTCSRGHPCPSVSAEASKRHLAGLLGRITGTRPEGHYLVEGPPLRCEASGTSYERVVARCSSPRWGDLGCRMVLDGYALEWLHYGRACH